VLKLKNSEGGQTGEKMELTHAPVKGYRVAFYISVAVAALYLGVIFFTSL
jgi:hypothetical protein